MIKKLSYLMSEYKTLKTKMDSTTTTKDVLLATIWSIAINLVIYLIPVLLVYNLFIFDSLIILLKIIIFILVICFSFTYQFIYIKVIRTYYERLEQMNFKLLIIFDSILTASILVIFTAVVMSLL
ncbi:hypothetical protein [Haploplasma axanthum]|uniref:Uncharacterized protein n=1 Tax=Haploplasma axanthum TaxID=29552 RepID=A0A449BED7_HAPAX|nr:hypothetical protein [Haploplasma axanthum]VEU80797.1 Uncharacterised protein [Haploplasma axanthum]